ncbi:MAG TPA: prolipoprotein diacylglyceryl transferase [Candidatus Cloacimonadota bacterium]|nr:prolipoprotein diacylglyceryl transferase [Candidatus Cloacimonadota bacterium]HQL15045.1 prolipoprotein diacylglyceryl transferase [Candidatus Cloacimonadota bacterium]
MIPYPNINPDIVKFNVFGITLQIRWYGMFYVISFILGYLLYRYNLKLKKIELTKEQYEGLIFAIMLGVIIGGRLGYVLFYNLPYYLKNPLEIFAVWSGGMSFHGGALGVIIAGLIFVHKHKLNFLQLADPIMPLVAIGLGLGRLGNFINGELYGRVTNVPWAMIFPDSDGLPRHPSQLYELFLEGIVLAIICQVVYKKSKISGMGFWTFIGFYGIFRIFVEFFREPDKLDLYSRGLFFGFVTVGMLLSFFMVIAAAIGIFYLYKKNKPLKSE